MKLLRRWTTGLCNMPKSSKYVSDPVRLFDTKSINSTHALELLTLAETAGLLKIAVPTLRRLQQQHKIPSVKVGGGIRFLKSDLAAYITKMRVDVIE